MLLEIVYFVVGATVFAAGFVVGFKIGSKSIPVIFPNEEETLIPKVADTTWTDKIPKPKPEVKVFKIDDEARARKEKAEEEAEKHELPHPIEK